MIFTKHSKLEGLHAAFSPSQSSWLRYDDEKLKEAFVNKQAASRGTKLHAWAKETIDLKIKQPRSKKTLYMYVNDAIGFKMSTEVVLFYSEYFFGTVDAIAYRNKFLRIHDLKTGKGPTHMEQLLIYAALFCLEYNIKPESLEGCELRIYQNDDYEYDNPTAEEIRYVMNRIEHMNKVISQMEEVV